MTIPAIGLPKLSLKVNVEELIVDESISSEKTAETLLVRAMSVAESAGEVVDTVGGVVSAIEDISTPSITQ